MAEKKLVFAAIISTLLLSSTLLGVSYQMNVSYSRFSDGKGSWYKISDYITPVMYNQVGNRIIIYSNNLVINEFMADNDNTVAGPNGLYPDWVELFNTGSELIDLSGMYLTDNLNDSTAWQFPEGTFIAPYGYLLVWADNDFGQNSLHANFKLRANGGVIGLFGSDGKTLIDSIAYDKQLRDVSYGRIPDGSSNWYHLIIPTPGSTNQENPPPTESPSWSVVILIILIIVVSVSVIIGGRISSRKGL